jgi:2,3-dihydroxybenzoate decarboxylase
MVKKIALEEHFLCPGFVDYWNPTAADLPAARREAALARLTDFGETRLAAMDSAGIVRAVLGLAGPGVQAERDTPTAIRKARDANDARARDPEATRPLFGLCPPSDAACFGRRHRA